MKFISCLLFICLLSSCGGHTTRVIDTPETRELKGWEKPYEVDGERYHPLRNHQGFSQAGIASWYGRKFHGRKTSNGEVYDMYAMTAAHKTLPMGVFVRVTRLDTGHQMTVRVNDRGPFVAGRIIDLSYAAAKELGIVESGTTRVRVEALGYPEKNQGGVTYLSPPTYDKGRFAVQVGAYSQSDSAYRLADKMRRRFGAASVSTIMVNKQKMYRVRVGDYQSLERAETTVQTLEGEGYQGSFVVAFE